MTWTSVVLEILHDELAIKVSIKREILEGLTLVIDEALKGNWMEIKALQSLAGKASCVSSLVHVWRPFASML